MEHLDSWIGLTVTVTMYYPHQVFQKFCGKFVGLDANGIMLREEPAREVFLAWKYIARLVQGDEVK